MSWYECLAYCHWRAAESRQPYRLPSEAEWEKTARGTDGRKYPWGRDFEPERLNSIEGDRAAMSTTPVGIYPTGASPYGCLDMAGNVWEMTRSLREPRASIWWMRLTGILLWWRASAKIKKEFGYPYDPPDGRENHEDGIGVLRVLRGGSWYDFQDDARCASRDWYFPYFKRNYIGFRIVVSHISN